MYNLIHCRDALCHVPLVTTISQTVKWVKKRKKNHLIHWISLSFSKDMTQTAASSLEQMQPPVFWFTLNISRMDSTAS